HSSTTMLTLGTMTPSRTVSVMRSSCTRRLSCQQDGGTTSSVPLAICCMGPPDSVRPQQIYVLLYQQLRRLDLLKRRVPDFRGEGTYGTVGGEPAHAGDIHDTGLGPGLLLLVKRIDTPLRVKIIFEIGRHHVVVGMAQRMDQPIETLWLACRKNPSNNCIHRLCGGRRCNQNLRVVCPGLAAPGHLVGVQPANKDIF